MGPNTISRRNKPVWLRSFFVCILGVFTVFLALYTRAFLKSHYLIQEISSTTREHGIRVVRVQSGQDARNLKANSIILSPDVPWRSSIGLQATPFDSIHFINLSSSRNTSGDKVPDWFVSLTTFRGIEEIQISDRQLCRIKSGWALNLPELKRLHLHGAENADEILKEVHNMHSLEQLSCMSLHLTPASLQSISNCKSIKLLSLRSCMLSTEDFSTLSKLENLEALAISDNPVGNEAWPVVCSFPKLKSLSISDTLIEDTGCSDVTLPHSLESVDISNTAVGNTFVNEIVSHSNLKEVDIRDTNVDSEGVTALLRNEKIDVVVIKKADVIDGGKYNSIKQEINKCSKLILR